VKISTKNLMELTSVVGGINIKINEQ
jgi:hypothetical protein